jgi:5-methyltetrahydrofolate--homocysteine methyltransferase
VLDGINTALDSGKDPGEILNTGMITAMGEVGRLFEEGEYFVLEMLISARAMQSGLEILKPHLVASGVEPKGKVVIGTVRGDLHDIGKNLVAMMIEGAGYEVIDLGTDVPPERFVGAIREGVNLVGMSALLTTTMAKMSSTIEAIESAGLRGTVKIIIGGAPVTQGFADQIGADGFAEDASKAVSLIERFVI